MKSIHRRAALALTLIASGIAINVDAANVSKNSGATTPTLSDFSTAFAGHPNKTGYNNTAADRMFLETFQTPCAQGQKVTSARFSITVRKLTQGANRGDNDALAFWDNQNALFNTYLWAAVDAPGTTKTLNYDVANLPPMNPVTGIISSPGNGMSLLGDFDFSFSVQDDTSVLSASLEYACSSPSGGGDKKGMTWGVYPAHPVTGTATVACQGTPGPDCNAYTGDQACSIALPVLCMKPSGLPNPLPNTVDPQHWSGNVIATTPTVVPATKPLSTLAQVNAYCSAEFGPGWVVADFHAGTGWKFGAYGNVGQPGKSRFWVNIKDQANANCWTQ